MHVDVIGQPDESLKRIAARLDGVLADVRATVEDWQPMRAQAREIIASIDASHAKVAADEAEEVRAFLQWLHDDHFTFIGFRDHDLEGRGKTRALKPRSDSGLGILRDPARPVFEPIDAETGGVTSP